MERKEYIFKKLGNLSPMNNTLADEIVKELGEWVTINEVAKYFKKHRNTIYKKVEEGDIIHRKMGTSILIYTRILIFLLE